MFSPSCNTKRYQVPLKHQQEEEKGRRKSPNKETFLSDIMIFNLFQKLKYTFTSFKIQYIWHATRKEKNKQISTQIKRESVKETKTHRSDDKMYIQSFTNTGTARKETKTWTYSDILHVTRGRAGA